MRVAVRMEVPAMLRAVLLVVAAVEITTPTPLLGSNNERRRIDGFYLASVVQNVRQDLVHLGTDGMDVAMGRGPDTGLIVHEIVLETAVRRSTPLRHDVLNPSLLEGAVR